MYPFALRCLFAGKHIYLGWVDCLEVNQLEPRRYFLMKMLSHLCYFPDTLINLLGQIIHPRHSHHFSLIVLHLPVNTNARETQVGQIHKYTAHNNNRVLVTFVF